MPDESASFWRADPTQAARTLRGLGIEPVDLAGTDAASAARVLRDLDIEHIITFSDRLLVRTAEISAEAGFAFLSVRTAVACSDKLAQRRTLAEAGVDSVRSCALDDMAALPALAKDVGLPVVVKPRLGAGSVDTVRLDTEAQAEQWSTKQAQRIRTVPGACREFVVEELLVGDSTCAGPEFGDFLSVESVVQSPHISHLCVTGKFPLVPPFRECGMIVPSTVTDDVERECRELAEKAIQALGIHLGVVHTEMKLTPTGPRVIEVNARVPGYMPELLSRATGACCDLIATALRTALGLPVAEMPTLLDQVTYVYIVQPPQDATRLVSIAGPHTVTSIPGVRGYEPYVKVGEAVDWRWGTSQQVGLLTGEADDHQAALAGIEAALGALEITYE
ncbi:MULTISPECIES: ATP-grasp domain-containing protein [unclassified Streptomyces]|uniref:ATP-grasp domain-containing protein n=1 Tax=unclassified Streptomyces TaxID=2593676 RepID=UPI003809FAB4